MFIKFYVYDEMQIKIKNHNSHYYMIFIKH